LRVDRLFFTLRFSCFFFSSRRRHTRSKRDWSSDVCSSDLVMTRRLHDSNRTMVLAIVSHISGLIALAATVTFVVAILAAAGAGSTGMLGASLMAGAFGTVVAGVVTLYTLYVLVKTGDTSVNNYG